MGLLLKLENGDTALKSLKFGKDRFGGGSSNQPYIKNPIIDEPGKLSQADNDFIFRNGIKAPLDAAEDVARLTKYMFDFKSPSGLLFIAKQNLLSRVSVATEASISAGYANNPSKELAWTKAPINQGIYTPLSTLLQAGVGFTGTHLNLLGINPFTPMSGVVQGGFLPGLGLVRYEDVVRGETRLSKRVVSKKKIPIYAERSVPAFGSYGPPPVEGYRKEKTVTRIPVGQYENRLLYLWEKDMIVTDNAGGTILTYSGGPGSILGIGKTRINFADQRTGLNHPMSDTEPAYFYRGGVRLHEDDYVPNYTGLLQASIAQGLTDEEIGIRTDGTLGSDGAPRFYGPSFANYTLSKYNPTGMPLTGSGGYQVGLSRPENTINYNNLLGVSKIEGLDEYGTGIDPTTGTNFNLFGPQYAYFTLSKNNPGLTLSGSGGYQIGKQNHLTEVTDTTYRSVIQEKLKEYGRELLSDSSFDIGGVSGDARTWAPTSNTNREKGANTGKFINKYSSKNTLSVDPRIILGSSTYTSTFRADENKATLINNPNSVGYLANLNKNSGIYEDPKNPGNYVTQHNPNRVGGRGIAADFRLVNRDKRGFFDPTEKDAYDYITGTSDYSSNKTLDKIYYYTSTQKRTSKPSNNGVDLIDFKIDVINPTTPSNTLNLRFRAYIDNLSDSYGADWKSQTYMGRGEKFWKYDSFSRDMSLGFTVVADNETNLNSMYTDLNKLAASLAPTYTGQGYMAGNLHQLTVGNYINNQYGIITGFTYDIMDDSPWEIMPSVQLPFYIKVTGLKFTPIHDFRPSSFFNEKDPGYGKFIGQT